MDYLRTLLEQQPLMTLFLTIAIGYLVGEINIKGFSLGVGAVLFVALAVGWFAPKSAPAGMVGTLGLALFLYAVGVQYGKQFFLGLTSAAGRRANLIALVGVFVAGIVSLLIAKAAGLDIGYALGLFAGSGTSTPTLQAAIATLGNDDPAVGYSVSYPFGVAGPILFLYFAFMILKPKIETTGGSRDGDAGDRAAQPEPLRQDHGRGHERPAAADQDRRPAHRPSEPAGRARPHRRRERRRAGRRPDQGGARADPQEPRRRGARAGGQGPERSRLSARLRLQGRASSAGRSATSTCRGRRASSSPRCAAATPTSCRVPTWCSSSATASACSPIATTSPALSKFFGDSIKGTAEFSYISIGLGMALGFLLGAIQIPLPGIGKLSIGLVGRADRGPDPRLCSGAPAA